MLSLYRQVTVEAARRAAAAWPAALALPIYAVLLVAAAIARNEMEIEKLDSGESKGWTRTGKQFRAHETLVNGTNPVCRYYIPADQGDSHFFSAFVAECAKVHARFPSFVTESEAVMHIAPPHHVTGKCANDLEPVYRLWNGRLDSNHRYVTETAVRGLWQSYRRHMGF